MPKLNNLPMGENSSNLVTLFAGSKLQNRARTFCPLFPRQSTHRARQIPVYIFMEVGEKQEVSFLKGGGEGAGQKL
jgi:hypothetical protein